MGKNKLQKTVGDLFFFIRKFVHEWNVHLGVFSLLKLYKILGNFCFSEPIFHRKQPLGRERKPNFFGIENTMQRGIRKILTFVKLEIAAKIFGKIIMKPL